MSCISSLKFILFLLEFCNKDMQKKKKNKKKKSKKKIQKKKKIYILKRTEGWVG